MFWPSSTKQAGYGKGNYSPALPGGVACIGLIFLALGLLASFSLPTILMETITNHVCILHTVHEDYQLWTMNGNREVNVTVMFWNLTNDHDFFYNGAEAIHTLSEKYVWKENSFKKAVSFTNATVKFKKILNLTKIDSVSSNTNNAKEATIFDASRFLVKLNSSQELNKFYNKLTTDLADGISLTFQTDVKDYGRFWHRIFDYNQTCQELFSTNSQRIKFCLLLTRNQLINKKWTPLLVELILNFINDLYFSHSFFDDKNDQDYEFIDYSSSDLYQNSSILMTLSYFHLYKNDQQFNFDSIINGIHYFKNVDQSSSKNQSNNEELLSLMNYLEIYVFRTLKIFCGTYEEDFGARDRTTRIPTLKGDPENLGRRMMDIILGQNAQIKLNVCGPGWKLNGKTIFTANRYNRYSYLIDQNRRPYSEFNVPPISKLCPCLDPTPASHYFMAFDGIWNPIDLVRTDHSDTFNDYTVYKYIGKIEGPLSGLNYYGLPLFFSSPCRHIRKDDSVNSKILSDICSTMFRPSDDAEVTIEPYTGSIWQFTVRFQLNVKMPPEFFTIYNISRNYLHEFLPVMVVERKASLVGKTNSKFLNLKVTPFLTAICFSSFVFLVASMLVLSLALFLIIKLKMKTIEETIIVTDAPNVNVDQVNTVKLRKLLGE